MEARPFHQFVVKAHSRCNLACDYCYVYELADRGWRDRPRSMSPAVVRHTAERVARHVRTHALTEVEVVLHGGEPLLIGPAALESLVRVFRAAVPARVRFSVQTNGTLLDRPMLELLRALGVRVGVSVDGSPESHDRHRVRPDGTGSWDAVRTALHLLADEFRPVYGGLLCVVDVRDDPVRTYESLREFTPPVVDFLLPHGNWSAPPPGRVPGAPEAPYGEWLVELFEHWYVAPETRVRLFEELLNVVLGGRSGLEGVGLTPSAQIVVETDGSLSVSDILASSSPRAARTGLHVLRDDFDRAAVLPAVLAERAGLAGLSATCRKCPVVAVCGGGLRAHRFDGSGFDRPSVYCPDLFRLTTHMRERVAADLAALA
ncbi:FxsB family cyclophane-forming radical SAM/SPASM peptide maturase [Saccharothrix obliqua]|uniref:FxsB family cyclophane-forming radical SAM/SPASM peptide maturase n=1 Tax=Saccharothrix obliqua TaxID=2861747 RepID=UPI001C5FF138|nr:FxsB family cyclophane-forming radical SAM/SPASM peptide maturase [Saccharothrix obliqua]MBW4721039.1 FxsB family radical SAM/SPASM domain protein [Saccharothrix obliqua]